MFLRLTALIISIWLCATASAEGPLIPAEKVSESELREIILEVYGVTPEILDGNVSRLDEVDLYTIHFKSKPVLTRSETCLQREWWVDVARQNGELEFLEETVFRNYALPVLGSCGKVDRWVSIKDGRFFNEATIRPDLVFLEGWLHILLDKQSCRSRLEEEMCAHISRSTQNGYKPHFSTISMVMETYYKRDLAHFWAFLSLSETCSLELEFKGKHLEQPELHNVLHACINY